ncbi:MAG: 30S ribosomal protein S20 [Planctomycetes bacterium]|nr:30S ribosomal protein S20 [Planctomycetota bacterium]
MPRSGTTKKRIRQNIKRRLRNRAARGVVRAQVKKFLATLEGGDAAARQAELKSAIRTLDKAAAHGVMHKNAVARRKSRLVAKLKKAGAAPSSAAPAPQA